MNREPLRSVILGYGLAALGACGVAGLGAGVVAAVATAWLGGALLTLGVAAIAARRQLETGEWAGIDGDAPADIAAAGTDLTRWRADQAAETGALRVVGPRRRA